MLLMLICFQSVESKGQTFRVGDYVYIEPLRPDVTQCHIGRITRISEVTAGTDKSSGITEVKVRFALYMRPSEAKPSRRRRLLAAEVFRTAISEVVPPSKLAGHCLVMHISHFIRSRPKVSNPYTMYNRCLLNVDLLLSLYYV